MHVYLLTWLLFFLTAQGLTIDSFVLRFFQLLWLKLIEAP